MTNSINPMSGGASPACGGNDGSADPSHVSNFNDAMKNYAKAPAPGVDLAASNSNLTSLISQLIPLLQQLLSTLKANPSAGGAAPPPTTQDNATPPNPPAGAAPATDQSQLTSLLQQLLSDLQGGANSGGSGSDEASLIQQLIPLLQQQLGGASPAGGKDLAAAPAGGSGNDEASLIQQLITMLQAQGGQSGPAAQPGATPPSDNPGAGISGAEINAMLAYANGTGPKVDF